MAIRDLEVLLPSCLGGLGKAQGTASRVLHHLIDSIMLRIAGDNVFINTDIAATITGRPIQCGYTWYSVSFADHDRSEWTRSCKLHNVHFMQDLPLRL